MARNGKIARMPWSIRDLLNRRLHDGESGVRLVEWLNASVRVQALLEEDFGGRAINEQNLTEWKQGGYQDWLRRQETVAWMRDLIDESTDLKEEAGDFSVGDYLSVPIAVALGRWIQQAATSAPGDPGQLRLFLDVAREISHLRRQDHQMEHLRLTRETLEAEDLRREKEEWDSQCGALQGAEAVIEVRFRQIKEEYEEKKKEGSLSPDDEKRYQEAIAKIEEWQRARDESEHLLLAHPFGQIRPNQTKSKQIKLNQADSSR